MKKLYLIALLAALVVGFGVYRVMEEISKPAETPRTVVVVAARDIPGKTMLTEDMVKLEAVATEALQPGYLESVEDAVGMVISSDVYAGEQIVSKRLVLTGTTVEQNQTLAYKLDEGMRAITISVGSSESQANMVKPGNCIDIYASYSYEEEPEEDEKAAGKEAVYYDADGNAISTEEKPEPEVITTTQLLMQNVPVLAVGNIMSKDGSEEYSTFTLQVSPEDAGKLIFAQWQTSISIVLRSPLDTEILEDADTTMDDLRGIDDEEVTAP